MRRDLSIAGLAFAGALYVAARHPLAAALTMALGMGFGLAALTIEPATTRAAFEKR